MPRSSRTARLAAALACLTALVGCDGSMPGPSDGGSSDAATRDGGTIDGAPPTTDAGADAQVAPDAGPPPDDGRFGVPTVTFTLPAIDPGAGYYYPDIQASFPEVDWARLDRLYIPAGHYRFIRIGNLPTRDPSTPIVITNLGGQVRVGGLGHYYLFALGGGSGWVLTGRYDPLSATGDAAFPGHRGGAYANSQGTYGILVDDDFVREGNHGIAVGGRATRFEIEHVEVREIGFAGISIKTDDDGTAHMEDVVVHDVYIHDVGSEGFYIGSTQAQPQHTFRSLVLHDNRVLRTGTEAIQLGQLAGHVEVHHNVFGPSAIDWRAAFQRYQDGNLQISVRSGTVDVHHNVFLGGAGSQGSLFGALVDGDAHAAEDRVWIHDNYFAHFRSLFTYVASRGLAPMTWRFERNAIRGYRFDYDEVYDGAAPAELVRVGDAETVVELVDNRLDVEGLRLCGGISDLDGNGANGNRSGSGNVRGDVPPVRFRDAGLPADFDYLDLEMWTAEATLGRRGPVSYPRGTIVTHLGVPYRCEADPCAPGLVPDASPAAWTALPSFPDDVRLAPDSPHAGVGLSR
jgi:hypothetical protein